MHWLDWRAATGVGDEKDESADGVGSRPLARFHLTFEAVRFLLGVQATTGGRMRVGSGAPSCCGAAVPPQVRVWS